MNFSILDKLCDRTSKSMFRLINRAASEGYATPEQLFIFETCKHDFADASPLCKTYSVKEATFNRTSTDLIQLIAQPYFESVRLVGFLLAIRYVKEQSANLRDTSFDYCLYDLLHNKKYNLMRLPETAIFCNPEIPDKVYALWDEENSPLPLGFRDACEYYLICGGCLAYAMLGECHM